MENDVKDYKTIHMEKHPRKIGNRILNIVTMCGQLIMASQAGRCTGDSSKVSCKRCLKNMQNV